MSVRNVPRQPMQRIYVGHVPHNGVFNVVNTADGALAVPMHKSEAVVTAHPFSYAHIAARANPGYGIPEPTVTGCPGKKTMAATVGHGGTYYDGRKVDAPDAPADGLVGIKVGSEKFMGSDNEHVRAVRGLLADAAEAFRYSLGSRTFDGNEPHRYRTFHSRVGKLRYELTLTLSPYHKNKYTMDIVAIADGLTNAWPVEPILVGSWDGQEEASWAQVHVQPKRR